MVDIIKERQQTWAAVVIMESPYFAWTRCIDYSRESRVACRRHIGPRLFYFITAYSMDDWNSPTTKLLTLLNVSSAKSLKRKFLGQQGSPPHKLNKRRVLDRDSSNSIAEVNTDAESVEHEASEAGSENNSPDDVGTGEAADLSDAEGVIHLWPRGSCCLTINRERAYV
jgi:hypothetical protein